MDTREFSSSNIWIPLFSSRACVSHTQGRKTHWKSSAFQTTDRVRYSRFCYPRLRKGSAEAEVRALLNRQSSANYACSKNGVLLSRPEHVVLITFPFSIKVGEDDKSQESK